jgi:hypothetical protein
MGQRHNRRRTRPRSRNRLNIIASDPPPYLPLVQDDSSSVSSPILSPVCALLECDAEPLAPIWHTRFAAWQPRGREQGVDGFGAVECRLFGGKPGDDVNLCYNMLDFFGRLDYIDK